MPKADHNHGTLENVYDQEVRKLLQEDHDAAIDYMLKSAPFIKQYTCEGTVTTTAPKATEDRPGNSDVQQGGQQAQKQLPIHPPTNFDTAGFIISHASSKHLIYSQFMAHVEGDFGPMTRLQPKVRATNRGHNADEWICDACNVPKVYNPSESCIICPECGVTIPYVEMNQKNLTFDEQVNLEVSNNCAYKRVNHFSEWVISLQARESTVIPEEVLDAIRLELKKARFTTCDHATPQRVKSYLKKLRLAKWYEHTMAICHALGTPAPRLSPALETKLKSMFQEIQAPFDKWVKVVAPKRRNFLSYSYVLHKFSQLLGEDDLLVYFPLLKSQEKLRAMDVIWQRICAELEWEYIPSC